VSPSPAAPLPPRPASRSATRAWDTAYADGGVPTWEIGRPQPAVVRLLEAGAFGPPGSKVLDAGCGTGENALLLASRGHPVVGIDIAAEAIARARARAAEMAPRRAPTLLVGDALDAPTVAALGPFDAALDVGLFHSLAEDELPRYVASLTAAVRPGGHAFLLCWSDRNPFGRGPRRVARREIREAFRAAAGWRVERIEPEELSSRLPGGPIHAWLARLTRRA
jgi:cyclopropane fatty-acyl-phospholipid synthase-like methyltransferase